MLHKLHMANSIIVRMNVNTLRRLKRVFPALNGETARHYFQRLAKYIYDGGKTNGTKK